jgi:hypothetical protein
MANLESLKKAVQNGLGIAFIWSTLIYEIG